MIRKKQKTIQAPISCTGVGLHTGVESTITFNPAPENFGIKFLRTDQAYQYVTPDLDNVIDLTRGTTIEENGIKVHTTEHVLSACAGMAIDNLLIELNSKEPPVMDGSAKDFVSALVESGIVEQKENVNFLKITKPVVYTDEDKDVEVVIESFDTPKSILDLFGIGENDVGLDQLLSPPLDVRVQRLARIAMILEQGDSGPHRALQNRLPAIAKKLESWTAERLSRRHASSGHGLLKDAKALGERLADIPGPGAAMPLEMDLFELPDTQDLEGLTAVIKRLEKSVMLPSAMIKVPAPVES